MYVGEEVSYAQEQPILFNSISESHALQYIILN